MNNKYFRRKVNPSPRDPRVLVDSELKDKSYVESFGFEWTEIDGFVGKESMLHGHVFGRFLLPNNFFAGKTVIDVGCGNGRIGRLVAPFAKEYLGLDLSDSVYAFPNYLQTLIKHKFANPTVYHCAMNILLQGLELRTLASPESP